MSPAIDRFSTSVRQLLDRPPRTHNDFVSLAISGEQLRRACEVAGPSAVARATLAEYDRALASDTLPSGDDLPSLDELTTAIDDLLARFDEYARTAPTRRDPETGEELLYGLDDACSIASACVRRKRFAARDVYHLSTRIAARVGALASRCTDLAQLAEDRQLLFGPDPVLGELFEWWEPLAELAPSRIALASTTVEEARRARLIANAVAAYGARVADAPPPETREHEPAALASRALLGLLDNLAFDPGELRAHASPDALARLVGGLHGVGRDRGEALRRGLTREFDKIAWLRPQLELARAAPAGARGASPTAEEPDDEALLALAQQLAEALARD